MVQPGATIGLAHCLKKEAEAPGTPAIFSLSRLIPPVGCCGALQTGERKNIRTFTPLQNRSQ